MQVLLDINVVTLLSTFFGAVTAGLAWWQSRKNTVLNKAATKKIEAVESTVAVVADKVVAVEGKVDEVHTTFNSRMSALMEAIRREAHAEGLAQGRAEERQTH